MMVTGWVTHRTMPMMPYTSNPIVLTIIRNLSQNLYDDRENQFAIVLKIVLFVEDRRLPKSYLDLFETDIRLKNKLNKTVQRSTFQKHKSPRRMMQAIRLVFYTTNASILPYYSHQVTQNYCFLK